MVTLQAVQEAAEAIREGVRVSPVAYSERLSQLTGSRTFFKLENLQVTGSFKERGACNKLLRLSPEERSRGVIAASAGNHAQGLAYHAKRLGIAATIVMPVNTPLTKVSETERHGGRVILSGRGYDEAFEEAQRLEQELGAIYVHAFDDPVVIAGQGTVGLELVEQVPDLDAVIVAVGGGGLAAGLAVAIKGLKPEVRIIGVEAKAMPTLLRAREVGHPVLIERQHTIAEGVAVGKVGQMAFDLLQRHLDQLVLVNDEEIAEAILLMLEQEKTVTEGAGAAPLAALRNRNLGLTGKTVALVVGGGNIDMRLVARIIERGLTQSGRTARIRVTLDDVPGTLAKLLSVVGEQQGNILSVHHERAQSDTLGKVFVDVVTETRDFAHIDSILRALREAGFERLELRPQGVPAPGSTGEAQLKGPTASS